MLIGAMNHPQLPLEDEIRWMAQAGLDFIDLTLEPPAAAPWKIDAKRVRGLLAENKLGAVGHTAPYLPLAHPYELVRKAAVEQFVRCAEVFAKIGVRLMNIHPDRHAPMHDRAFMVERNLTSLREIHAGCAGLGVELMLENLPGDFNTSEQLADLLDPLPWLGLHLDIGHTNLEVSRNTTAEILSAWQQRLRHVHLHDNKGGTADLHLPLGAGTLDVAGVVNRLRKSRYNGTITLEVYSPDRELLLHSMSTLRRLWRG